MLGFHLHALCRNAPDGVIKIELVPRRSDQLTRACERERQHLQGNARLQVSKLVISGNGLEQRWQFFGPYSVLLPFYVRRESAAKIKGQVAGASARGDGYFDIDTAVAKIWLLPRGESVRFDWEVFNATNSVRFDDSPVSSFGGLNEQLESGTLGIYSSLLKQSRKQQFSLRYSF